MLGSRLLQMLLAFNMEIRIQKEVLQRRVEDLPPGTIIKSISDHAVHLIISEPNPMDISRSMVTLVAPYDTKKTFFDNGWSKAVEGKQFIVIGTLKKFFREGWRISLL